MKYMSDGFLRWLSRELASRETDVLYFLQNLLPPGTPTIH